MKKIFPVLIILLILMALIAIRLSNKNVFRNDAGEVIEAIENNSNLIFKNQLTQDYLIVNLDDNSQSIIQSAKTLNIPLNNLLEKENQKLLKNSELKITLYSENISNSVQAFTLLNQLGFENLFILQSDDSDEEILQYEFLPDTTSLN